MCVLCAYLIIISPSRIPFRRKSRAAVDIMPVAGLDSSRAGVESGVGPQETKTTGPSVQLQILSQYADKVFNDLSLLIDSFDSRVSKLTSKVSSDPVKENSKFREQRSAIATPYDKNRKQVPFMKCDNVSLLNPESRDERTTTSYLCAQAVALPLLKKLDRLLDVVMIRDQTDACAKGFSDPSFFYTKWQSDEEARYVEMQTERLTRRGERHQRRISETKCGDDLSSNGDTAAAPRFSRIEELEFSDSDSEIDYPLFASHDVSCASSVVPDDDRQFSSRIPSKESFSLNGGISSSCANKTPLKSQRLESVSRSKEDIVGASKFPSGRRAQFS